MEKKTEDREAEITKKKVGEKVKIFGRENWNLVGMILKKKQKRYLFG